METKKTTKSTDDRRTLHANKTMSRRRRCINDTIGVRCPP
jgi:hypothetical protein